MKGLRERRARIRPICSGRWRIREEEKRLTGVAVAAHSLLSHCEPGLIFLSSRWPRVFVRSRSKCRRRVMSACLVLEVCADEVSYVGGLRFELLLLSARANYPLFLIVLGLSYTVSVVLPSVNVLHRCGVAYVHIGSAR